MPRQIPYLTVDAAFLLKGAFGSWLLGFPAESEALPKKGVLIVLIAIWLLVYGAVEYGSKSLDLEAESMI